MKKYIKHFITICRHKYYVAIELLKFGCLEQAVLHDLSKFSLTEFISSARYFCGDRSPIEKEKENKGYSLAWLNHKGRNKHHWQYWIDYKGSEIELCDIPENYLIEMAADLVGASKAYLKGKYNPSEPLSYFLKNSPTWVMKDSDKIKVEKYIRLMTDIC